MIRYSYTWGHMTHDRLPPALRRYDDTAIGSQRSANAATSPRAPGTVQIEPSAPSVTSTGQSRAVGRGARPAAMCRACECVGPCAVQGVSVARGGDARRVHGRVTAAGPATTPVIAPVAAPVIAPVISPVIANLPRGSVSVLRQPWSIDEQGGVREMGRGFEARLRTSRAPESIGSFKVRRLSCRTSRDATQLSHGDHPNGGGSQPKLDPAPEI